MLSSNLLTKRMGNHKKWRKLAKRERRRRIRVQKAKLTDSLLEDSSENYQNWLNAIEQFEYEQIAKSNVVENRKWIEAERIAIDQWNTLQERKKQLLQEYLHQEAKLKLEWEMEQKRKKEQEEKLKEIEEEKRKRHEEFMLKLEQFLSGDSTHPPAELLTSHKTRPHMERCPFFFKTACCRFGDQCSRNHQYPGISKVLLAPNFFMHFGLSNTNFSEYDTDVMLEYEDSDTHKEFVEFFNDVLPEFEKFGRITQFQVCNNYEKHLRGNTYVEYAELRCAVAAYQSLHARWYGGRQLSLQFCLIDSWKSAICGLASTRRCPKGRACNFLHVFRNPRRLFTDVRVDSNRSNRSWRWSESPEKDLADPKRPSSSSDRNHHRKEKSHRRKDRRTTSSRHSRRSKSPDRNKNR